MNLFALLVFFVHIAASTASSYNESIARVLSLYSSAAYLPPSSVSSWTLSDSCSDIQSLSFQNSYAVDTKYEVFGNNAGFGYIGLDHGRGWVVAAFKGSNDTADWIEDIEGGEYSISSCEMSSGTSVGNVHSGFCKYYTNLADLGIASDYLALLEAYPSYLPVITGHSLGATAAVLLAYDIGTLSGGSSLPLLYTFGLPRVGNYDFSLQVAQVTQGAYRLTHNRDMVPHLPKCCAGCSTSSRCPYHTATEVFYKGDVDIGESYAICDGSGEDSSCSNGQLDYSTSDHCEYYGDICGECY